MLLFLFFKSAGYVWAYNSQPYFEAVGESKEQIGAFMSWVPLVGGSLGVILGGKISDVWVNKLGPISRVLVLTASQVFVVDWMCRGWVYQFLVGLILPGM